MTIFSHTDCVVGLGLAVVAIIVEHLGRQLRAGSRIGDLPRFCFLLPFPVAHPNVFHSQDVSTFSPEDNRQPPIGNSKYSYGLA